MKRFFASLLAVVAVSTGIGMAANHMVKGVSKVNYNFIINENAITLPSNYLVMNKDNTTYVPLRFLSEQLGAKVDYKQGTIAIDVKPNTTVSQPEDTKKIKELEEEVAKLKKENQTLNARIKSIEDTIAYRKLPVVQDSINDLRIKLLSVSREGNNAKFNIEIINRSEERYFKLLPFKTVVYVDGVKYNANLMTDGILNSPLNSKDDRLQGNIVIEDLSEEKVKGSISFIFDDNGKGEDTMTMYFDNTRPY